MMHIGGVAKGAGVSVDAVRFYERCGILAKPPRTEGGFRIYSPEDVTILRFLRRTQALGFSLPQIRELLSLRRSSHRPCSPVRDKLRRKLADVHGKIRELNQLESSLRGALRRCERQLRKHSVRCPLLELSTEKASRGSR